MKKELSIEIIERWLKDSDCDVRQAAMNACNGKDVGELEDKLENGTMIELPYKVGNTTIKFENGEVVITSNSRNEV